MVFMYYLFITDAFDLIKISSASYFLFQPYKYTSKCEQ